MTKKINYKKSPKLKFDKLSAGLIAGFVIVFAASFLGILLYSKRNAEKNLTPVVPTGYPQNTTPPGKQNPTDTTGTGTNKSLSPKTISTDTVAITIEQSYQQTNGDLVIQTKIVGTTGTGTCSLRLIAGSAIIRKSAEVLFQPTFSTCTGFVIPASEFETSGTWKAELDLLNTNANTVATTSKNILIKK